MRWRLRGRRRRLRGRWRRLRGRPRGQLCKQWRPRGRWRLRGRRRRQQRGRSPLTNHGHRRLRTHKLRAPATLGLECGRDRPRGSCRLVQRGPLGRFACAEQARTVLRDGDGRGVGTCTCDQRLQCRLAREVRLLLLPLAPAPIILESSVPDEGGHQRSSEVIRGHQRPSEVIRGHQRSSEAIRGHQRSSEAIRDHTRERRTAA